MATLAAAAARQFATSSRISSARTSSQASNLIQRRGLAGAADHHGTPRINVWQDPLSPSKWKEEHFVIVSLSGWGLLIFGAYKFFTGGKGKKEEGVALLIATNAPHRASYGSETGRSIALRFGVLDIPRTSLK
ncbi:unnamed protein product [Prunus armeniaca]|uniref:Uncharacterized protein n=1 Tax=Prunus armeniaca TaxID=36596 RepID=A0A6J5UEP1_PRUAR|nr:unnamed protein product [Prunus armeniaca]